MKRLREGAFYSLLWDYDSARLAASGNLARSRSSQGRNRWQWKGW